MKTKNERFITRTEAFLIVALFAALISCGAPSTFDKVNANAQQTKQLSNAKQISLGCNLFAADNNGIFPNGRYKPELEKLEPGDPAATAEACFNDLIGSKILDAERIFWSPQHRLQCAPEPPDEDGTLAAEENCWDYIAGLTNSSSASLPLVFEASDGGAGAKWSEGAGHPWENRVIVAFVDGSASKEVLDKDGAVKTERKEKQVDLCIPVPGSDSWPAGAKIAPATAIR